MVIPCSVVIVSEQNESKQDMRLTAVAQMCVRGARISGIFMVLRKGAYGEKEVVMSDEVRAPITPDGMLADGLDGREIQGTYVRKGTVGAFIQNVKTLESVKAGTPEYETLVAEIRQAKPMLVALDLFEVFEVRDPNVAALLDQGHADE
jgi:hypothetical protein